MFQVDEFQKGEEGKKGKKLDVKGYVVYDFIYIIIYCIISKDLI